MDILKAEIARKRKQLEEKELLSSNKKYFKRSELVAKELEEYREKYGIVRPVESDTKGNTPQVHAPENDTPEHILPRHEVITRLRERGEPILLFGESEIDSFKRLRHCEILEPEVDRGFRNDFQEAMEQVDEAYLEELLASTGENRNESKNEHKTDGDDNTTYDDIKEMAKKMGCGDREHDMNVITKFIEVGV